MARENMSGRIVTVVITLVVAGVLGVVGTALIGGALIGVLGGVTKTEFDQRIAAGVPSGAVVAFDLSTGCPNGWSPIRDLNGRVIVGAHKDRAAEFGYRAIGGAKEHALTVEQMPEHVHRFFGNVGGEHDIQFVSAGKGTTRLKPERTWTKSAGKGEPFTNMPPYMALFFCKQD